MNINDPIYDYEIRDQAELNLNLWKVGYNIWERAISQGAPPALIERLKEIVECYNDASKIFDEIKPLFPQEPPSLR